MERMTKGVMVLGVLLVLSGCNQKNSFESCVEYWEKQAKESHGADWEGYAMNSIANNCRPD